ncbi:hypothetical protein [Streptomyces catenulae]|uniref:Uncharacterized protein n=1 Tax=Streptomyces catenulae TaxID=66875 RepID=A0ABV2YX97_9ACTN|nr:hypothetical protein [Streptomyces catenulae]
MQSRTNTTRRVRTTAVVVLIAAAVWAGTTVVRNASHADTSAPTGPVAHLRNAVELIRG